MRLRVLTLIAMLCVSGIGRASDELLMARSMQSFPEAMTQLQLEIKALGYTVSHVQRVDIGLTTQGYATDKYRVVFFGKPAEVHALSHEHPELVPYLPWKLAIFAEEDSTVVVTLNPSALTRLFPDLEPAEFMGRWEQDLRTILLKLRKAN